MPGWQHRAIARASLGVLRISPTSEYHCQWYSNILVIAHRHGVTIFCREEEDKHLAILIKAAISVADVSHEYENFLANSAQQIEQWLKDLLESQQKHNRKGKIRRLSDWSEMMLETKAQALKAMNKGALVGNDALHNQLSEDLSRQWGLSEQRQELMTQIEQLISSCAVLLVSVRKTPTYLRRTVFCFSTRRGG